MTMKTKVYLHSNQNTIGVGQTHSQSRGVTTHKSASYHRTAIWCSFFPNYYNSSARRNR